MGKGLALPNALIALCLALASTACGQLGRGTPLPSAASPAATPAAVVVEAPLTQDFVTRVAAKATPGIVQITNERQVLRGSGQELVPAGVGTGFVIDKQGHILTNNHVIAEAQKLEVQTTDGKTFPAKLTGRDPRTDLAVIQVEGQNLPVVSLGDSGKLQVGQWVVAIGHALGLEGGPTVTTGVVSAVGRTMQEPGDRAGQAGPYLFDLIQTDAAINPGNSGGPLLNLDAQVIGVNTLGAAMAEPGVPAQGINFAIAINTAKKIADQLIATGKVDHSYLGIAVTPNTPALAQRFGLPNKPGLAVAEVQAGGPAAKAGIQPKDAITAVDGKPLKDESGLSRALAEHKPGDTIKLTVARGDQTLEIQVTLGSAPAA
jgi:S1-C subfamily serine protease